ncbi:MAG TPA: hypothetical protein DEG69_14600 [Flavobacteriaceae bacterium]|nr:hypothetical protein [Flavobacteriaceae bacterium]
MHIDRKNLIAEELIRDHIRNRIKETLNEQAIKENKLRKSIRRLLEAETGTEEPSIYTGINVLADLLEKIIPIIEDDYKMLTTSEEQRTSFRNHIVKAIKNTLKPINTVDDAEEAATVGENIIFEIDKELLAEKVKINLDSESDDPADAVAGEFIDIAAPDDPDDFVKIDDQNETGRNFAAVTFKQVEKQIVDAYDMLADEEDEKMFYDYLLTNMLLYFDKFEDEIKTKVAATTTPEYEKEKEKENTEASADPETDDTDAAATEDDSDEDIGDPFADL